MPEDWTNLIVTLRVLYWVIKWFIQLGEWWRKKKDEKGKQTTVRYRNRNGLRKKQGRKRFKRKQ